MSLPEQRYRWTWELKASCEALWPLVSNTDRFNKDCAFPEVAGVPAKPDELPRPPGTRRLQARKYGVAVVWDEHPFEWTQPRLFSIRRSYLQGPLKEMLTTCTLAASPDGGTVLTYELVVRASNPLGWIAARFFIGNRTRSITERVFRSYDKAAVEGSRFSNLNGHADLSQGAIERVTAIRRSLVDTSKQKEAVVSRLCDHVLGSDDLAADRMRPYSLADEWKESRGSTLDVFLHATRAGLLDFSWDVLCPHCRGSLPGESSLSGVSSEAHCPTCNVDFAPNFDQSVELTFRPSPAIRSVKRREFCVGGPQVTPHIMAQVTVRPSKEVPISAAFPPGRYRVRSPGLSIQWAFRIEPGAPGSVQIDLGPVPPSDEPRIQPGGTLRIANKDASERVAVVERIAWSDQSTTAADVTSRQIFRDLFSREILRPGERISVGSLTLVFTDLKSSTQLYKTIGDAPAFGLVLDHFRVVKEEISRAEGSIVKTMGDAVMAVFTQPAAAIRAMLRAQERIRRISGEAQLALKCGIHCGPCLAINQNDRLDYFGTMVNLASRLCTYSSGQDMIISAAVHADPSVASLLADPVSEVSSEKLVSTFKGFGAETFEIWRLFKK